MSTGKIRRYDLDWLRVLLFAVLILYHTALGYVEEAELIVGYGNAESADWLLKPLLFLVQPWRLPAIFMISGMGVAFAFRRRSLKMFIKERTQRLLIPLVFGMNFVVLVDGYLREVEAGTTISFLGFCADWWGRFGETRHLWFLVNLYLYSLMAAPLFNALRKRPERLGWIRRSVFEPGGWGLLILPLLPLLLAELSLKPWLSADFGAGYEALWYFVFFGMGYLCIGVGDPYWKILARIRSKALLLAVVTTLLYIKFLAVTTSFKLTGLVFAGGWANYGVRAFGLWSSLGCLLHSGAAWFCCLSAFAWGAKWLNQPGRLLCYLNRAVYPAYIVHGNFLMVGLFYLKDRNFPWPLELVAQGLFALTGSLAIYEVAKRLALTRLLFGIKPEAR